VTAQDLKQLQGNNWVLQVPEQRKRYKYICDFLGFVL